MARTPRTRSARPFRQSAPSSADHPKSYIPFANPTPKCPTGRRCNPEIACPVLNRNAGERRSRKSSFRNNRRTGRACHENQTRPENIDAQTTARTNRYSECRHTQTWFASRRSTPLPATDAEGIPAPADRSSSFRCSSPSDRGEIQIPGSSHAARATCPRTTSSNRLG